MHAHHLSPGAPSHTRTHTDSLNHHCATETRTHIERSRADCNTPDCPTRRSPPTPAPACPATHPADVTEQIEDTTAKRGPTAQSSHTTHPHHHSSSKHTGTALPSPPLSTTHIGLSTLESPLPPYNPADVHALTQSFDTPTSPAHPVPGPGHALRPT
jgi:hypothetical protein